MEHKIPTLSSALSNHPESFFINNGAKVRFGTELKLTICHDIALGGRVGAWHKTLENQ